MHVRLQAWFPYYWTVRQAEYATDVMFRDPRSLAEIYPALVNHTITQFSCQDVMRFLGRRSNRRFSGTSQSSYASRVEGIRVKHWVSDPIQVKGRKYRALRPITAQESEVFRVVLRGEHQLQGVRNRDLRKHFYPEQEQR